MYFDKFNLIKITYYGLWLRFCLEAIFVTAPAALKNYACFKSGQKGA